MQARIRGLVRASVAVVVLAAAGGANAQLDKKEIRSMFAKGVGVALYPTEDLVKWHKWRFEVEEDGAEGIPEGWRYEGEERDGKPDGRGVLVVDGDDGARFEGEFRDGEPDGLFVMTDSDGSYAEIEYRDGKMHGDLIITSGNMSLEGGFRDGKVLHGLFVLELSTAEGLIRMEGEFQGGLVEGTVKITRPNGMVLRD